MSFKQRVREKSTVPVSPVQRNGGLTVLCFRDNSLHSSHTACKSFSIKRAEKSASRGAGQREKLVHRTSGWMHVG